MRQNPHVRICGGPGSATTLVYPTPPRGACVAVTPNLVWIAQVGDCVQVLYDRGRSCARGGGRGDGSWHATKGTRAPHGRLRVRSGNVHVIVAAIGYRM